METEEKGWILGYNESTFYFGLATEGADDGDGKMTYLKAKTRYEMGKLYHLTATYDGNKTEIYVNGNLENTTTTQSGNILYPDTAPYVLGAYQDADEFYPHHGRIRDVKVFGQAAQRNGSPKNSNIMSLLQTRNGTISNRLLKFLWSPTFSLRPRNR